MTPFQLLISLVAIYVVGISISEFIKRRKKKSRSVDVSKELITAFYEKKLDLERRGWEEKQEELEEKIDEVLKDPQNKITNFHGLALSGQGNKLYISGTGSGNGFVAQGGVSICSTPDPRTKMQKRIDGIEGKIKKHE